MSWADDLQGASFRGVPFKVDGAEGSYGRRIATHEYPLRDRPYQEDLGRKARSVVVEALVLGPDYMAARDALATALEQPGPGRLVHPYLGEITVVVGEFKLRESTAEGGVARFSITCLEAGEYAYPSAQIDTAAQAALAADRVIAVAQTDFAGAFATDGQSAFVADAAASQADEALDLLEAQGAARPTLAESAAAFGPQLAAARAGMATLLTGPAALGGALADLVSTLAQLVALPGDALALLGPLLAFGNGWPGVPTTTPSRVQQAANQAALAALVQRVAVAESVRSASQLAFTGYADAARLREQLLVQIDTLAEGATDDAAYDALVGLRSAMVRDITTRGADLARTVSFTPLATLPALVLAYSLYEDATRDAEIIARNNVRHPGFVPGGVALEVLADA